MGNELLNKIYRAKIQKQKEIAVLIDPDTPDEDELREVVANIRSADVDYIFLGGSLLVKDKLDQCIESIKKETNIPVILFPGSALQISAKADAILFLSLISGRNPELLIGTHVIAAPIIKEYNLEALPTGYMLIDSGKPTTASYMSASLPIPHNKPDIAACTAMAGEMLGLKLIYMDGGSGAENSVSPEMIAKVRRSVEAPIIVGGGIKTADAAVEICKAGADLIVVGNATEKRPEIITEIAEAVHQI